MDSIAEFSLETARWLQSNYPELEPLFGIFAIVGRFEFFLAVITLVYWCLNKNLGTTLAYLLSLSYTLNGLIKHILRDPRPYWVEPEIGLSEELSYGVTSGHAQSSTVLYGTIALWFRNIWVWILSIIMIVLMALSRIYLGVHDIEDVIAGVVVGLLILIAYSLWLSYGVDWFQNRILGQRLLIATSVPLAFIAIYIVLLIITDLPNRQVAWYHFVDAAEIESFENFTTGVSGFLGISIGLVLERSRVRFRVDGSIWIRILRYLVGLIGVLILWRGLGLVFPDEPLGLALPLRFLRYFLVSLWGIYYAPMVFTRLRLAEAAPEPDSSLTI